MGGVVREANQAGFNRRALLRLALPGAVEKLPVKATVVPDRSLRKVRLATISGIRRKLKPFSSVAVFEDQDRANPVPGEDDAPASLIDAQILAEYILQATLRVSAAWPDGPLSAGEWKAGIVRWLEEAA